MLRRVIGILAALLLAGLGTVVLVAYVQSAEDRALAGEETVEVYVLRQDVAEGTPATALADVVEVERIPTKVLADGVVTDLSVLDGQVATVDLLSGEQLVSQRFAAPESVGAVEVPEGLSEVTVSLSPERALAGELRPGDRVGVVASFTGQGTTTATPEGETTTEGPAPDETGDATHLILHEVLVTRIHMNTVASEGPETSQTAAPQGSVFVTLAVDAPSVERIVFTAEHGTLWLSHEPEGAITAGTQVQTREGIYR